MVKRATVADVAKAAGVSVATVDRALTGRSAVRPDTAERIAAAARDLNFHAAPLLAGRVERRIARCRIGILLQSPEIPFYSLLGEALRDAVTATDRFAGAVTLTHWGEQDPGEIAAAVRRLATRCDALAMVSPDHPTVTAAVGEIVASGKPVFSLLSDFAVSARTAYIGVDSRKAGRTAAWMIARAAPRAGRVAVFIGSHGFHGHELREVGFRSYFREHAPEFTVIDTPANMESNVRSREITREVLAAYPDLVGCYVAGGGMEGIIAALREAPAGPRPVTVCSSLTSESRAALLDGTVALVVAEPLDRICDDLISHVAASLEGKVTEFNPSPIELVCPENL
ncbi:LacI family transcriptional regulator [Aureimonas endophytica]|uniref:LacI family transcriptional regulator n=1 Tax=Aureimonas endophytica TaxID=2027858 RepID=A0A917E4S6_9HYPH|nr:LacI family DNA-binding transcriptional regulator [Aureimonas endophytica]GGE01297.1 LacI family transcriptional regulator [Aureimonas endophytica]